MNHLVTKVATAWQTRVRNLQEEFARETYTEVARMLGRDASMRSSGSDLAVSMDGVVIYVSLEPSPKDICETVFLVRADKDRHGRPVSIGIRDDPKKVARFIEKHIRSIHYREMLRHIDVSLFHESPPK
jgi:3-dehydroquinate dehydratase